MVEKEITPFSRSVYIQYVCPYCRKLQYSKVLEIPTPNFETKNVSRSFVYRKHTIQCKNCEQNFDVDIYNSVRGGLIEIGDLNEDEIIEWNIR